MLDEYRDKQSLAYNLFVKEIENNCVTHAYLIDENSYSDSFGLVLAFVKSILCENKYIKNDKCDNCLLCKKIDDGNYPELKIISADGTYIKKQQIIELQQEFSKTSVYGKKKIYIIKDCEKMRPEAANSLLKFLEEPEDGIIGILMTNNINNVLPTIISRCKIIKLNSFTDDTLLVDKELEELTIKFIMELENRGIDTIIDVKDSLLSLINIKDRDRVIELLDIMIDMYYDVMKIMSGNKKIKYYKLEDKIYELVKLNKLDSILRKINILIDAKDSVKYNVNINLLFDSIIVSIGGIKDGSRG